jgi:tellurite resistance protein TerC
MDFLLPFLTADFMGKPAWVWLSFVGIVIALIFSFFAMPRQYRHRVLFWGILGVIVLRAIMIGLGAPLVSQFSWVLYLFGAFLIFTGIKMWIIADHMPDIANNPLLKLLKRHMRVTDGLRGNAFWVRETDTRTGKLERFATPLFLAPVLVFIGSKIFLVGIVGKIPAVISLSVTFGLIAGGVLVSLWKTRGQPAVAAAT